MPPPRPLPPLQAQDVFHLAETQRIWRVDRQDGAGDSWRQFRRFGPLVTMRFDHHRPPPAEQDRAILYGAMRWPPTEGGSATVACLAEMFQGTRTLDRTDRSPCLVAFTPTAPLRLLDLTGSWPRRIGEGTWVKDGDLESSRSWARAIYEDYGDIDGLRYESAHWREGQNVALFERAQDRVPATSRFHRPLADPELARLLEGVAGLIGYAFV